ncbi:MAG: AAA family ATPase [Planctomycetales bacterium]|nr:AAA family ATPase [Planctomycetales bacterium]
MRDVLQHWIHALGAFVITVLGGILILPLVRTSPESLHAYLNDLPDVVRVSFGFLVSFGFVCIMFKVLKPRLSHLKFVRTHPPAWLTILLGTLAVASIELLGGIQYDDKMYQPTGVDWLLYGLVPIVVVSLVRLIDQSDWLDTPKVNKNSSRIESDSANLAKASGAEADIPELTQHNIETIPWKELEEWLSSEDIAKYDLLSNRAVATRLAGLLMDDTRSIGLVGPFGAGKSSVVQWIKDDLEGGKSAKTEFVFCQHSCWGYETSQAAIKAILEDAIDKISARIDTFSVHSLPESYRETFSAGGDWAERAARLLIKTEDQEAQFDRLSRVLDRLNVRLVFIVEDLDRNDTRKFESQEVMAFLQRLNDHDNLSFILTGALSGRIRIDFAKLCDHIQTLRLVDAKLAASVIKRVEQRCRDTSFVDFVPIPDRDDREVWHEYAGFLMADYEEVSLQQAVASLLRTPRALRHALGRTHTAWKTLHGEVNLNQLIVLNAIRYGAPEAFDFLLQRWDRLRAAPSRSQSHTIDRTDQFRESIEREWQSVCKDVEWNPVAVLKAMEFILPASSDWLQGDRGLDHGVSQPLSEQRYWMRAVNEAIEPDEVPDQKVLRDEQEWLNSHHANSAFVTGLASETEYSSVWVNLATKGFKLPASDCPLLLTQVFDRVCDSGVSANVRTGGLFDVWRTLNSFTESAEVRRSWLEQHFVKASKVSLRMASDLWHWFRVNEHGGTEVKRKIREALIDAVRGSVTSGDQLNALLDPEHLYTLYHLIFDSGEDRRDLAEVFDDWGWIRKPILEGLQAGHVSVAIATLILCSDRDGGERVSPPRVNREVFVSLFGDDSEQAVKALQRFEASENEAEARIKEFATSARHALDTTQAEGAVIEDSTYSDPTDTAEDEDE